MYHLMFKTSISWGNMFNMIIYQVKTHTLFLHIQSFKNLIYIYIYIYIYTHTQRLADSSYHPLIAFPLPCESLRRLTSTTHAECSLHVITRASWGDRRRSNNRTEPSPHPATIRQDSENHDDTCWSSYSTLKYFLLNTVFSDNLFLVN